MNRVSINNEKKVENVMRRLCPESTIEQIHYAYVTICRRMGYGTASDRPTPPDFFNFLQKLSDDDIRKLDYCPEMIAKILINTRDHTQQPPKPVASNKPVVPPVKNGIDAPASTMSN